MAKTRNALKILQKTTGRDPSLRQAIVEARASLEVAEMIYEACTRAGLSQRRLAELVGTKQPVIARLEDADYQGHSLTILRRIAEALGQQLELRFVADRRPPVGFGKGTVRSARRSA